MGPRDQLLVSQCVFGVALEGHGMRYESTTGRLALTVLRSAAVCCSGPGVLSFVGWLMQTPGSGMMGRL